MGFYNDWKRDFTSIECCDSFLNKEDRSRRDFAVDDRTIQENIVSVLSCIHPEILIDRIILRNEVYTVETAQIPQYSSFDSGTKRICEILDFFPEGLSFKDLGYQLCKSESENACIKYGENHSKLAKTLELVSFQKGRGNVVCLSPFGRELLRVSEDKREKVFKILLLREAVIDKLILLGFKGQADYWDVVESLSRVTAIRRRSNVKELLKIAIDGTKYSHVMENITWTERVGR